jgi:predicted Fe-S protein YdhL (DUF1289 family)
MRCHSQCLEPVVPEPLVLRVPTPCIGVCSTGIGDAVCRGCKRYAHEVIAWNSYSEEQKGAIEARLDKLLAQIVVGKIALFDPVRLERALQAQQIRFRRHRSAPCWVFDLLRAGASQIRDTESFGFTILPGYAHLSLIELREQIDREFYILSEAHYQRYLRSGWTVPAAY